MGSSGGGGASGAVSHSAYLETIHHDWLNTSGIDKIEKSITEVMDSALGSSPWTGLAAYNPDADIAAYEASITAFAGILAGLSDTADWAAFYAQAALTLDGVGEANITADVAAFQAQLDDNITTRVLPRFRRGMQDINAVVSSAFPIGESIIESFQARDVAKYTATLRMNLGDKRTQAIEQMMNLMSRRIGWEEDYTRMVIEANRIKIVAKKEQADKDAQIDEQDAKWDLEVFQHGGNLMAAIGGGTVIPNVSGKSPAASAIGGAMSGAAMGALAGMAMGPAAPLSVPMMALAGGILGGGAGLL